MPCCFAIPSRLSRRTLFPTGVALASLLLALTGPALPAASPEAEQIALILGNTLEPSPALADQVGHDLALLRAAYPALNGIAYHPPFVPSQVLMVFTEEGWNQVEFGTYPGWTLLEERYGSFTREESYGYRSFVLLTFAKTYHAGLLSQEITDLLPHLQFAEPNGYGGDGDRLTADPVTGAYSLSIGGGDCPAGCTWRRTWFFQVVGETVSFLRVQGDAVPIYDFGNNPWNHIPKPHYRQAEGYPVNFGLVLHRTGVFTVQWSKDGQPFTPAAYPSLEIPAITSADAGTYQVETTDQISGETVQGQAFTLVVEPADYLWAKPNLGEFRTWDLSGGSFINEITAFGYADTSREPLVKLHWFGWVYAYGTRSSAWFYDSELGWCYTAESAFPWLYSLREDGWVYYSLTQSTYNSRSLYLWNQRQWIRRPFSRWHDLPI